MSGLAQTARYPSEWISDAELMPGWTAGASPSNEFLTKASTAESQRSPWARSAVQPGWWNGVFNEYCPSRYPQMLRIIIRGSNGSLLVFADYQPTWLQQVAEVLDRVLSLPPGWDSYGAQSIDIFCAQAALRLLGRIMIIYPSTPTPSIVPSPEGGIQLEWHAHGVDLEIEIESSSTISAYYEILSEKEEWEDTLSGDLTPLDKPLRMLSVG